MTRNQIAAAIAKQTGTAATVELVKGEGYWYFTASDTARNIYDSQSEYVMYLSEMSDAEWIARGVSFINRVEAEYADR